MAIVPGPHNAITDVAGLKVGHYTNEEFLTGTTVVLVEGGAVGGVDVRGAAPGTRETELLDPVNLVSQVQAVVLSGGGAYGLAAANGVVRYLEERGLGYPVGEGRVVPIVPAAVLFDLGRGGDFSVRPTEDYGLAAALAAVSGPVAQGSVGAGAGAYAGGHIRGGLGTASALLPGGLVVGALVAANPVGLPFHPVTKVLYGAPLGLGAEFGGVSLLPSSHDPYPDPLEAVYPGHRAGQNTTIGVVATNARLTKAQAKKVAQMAHDGLARAISPAHTMNDGDTIFSLATGEVEVSEPGTVTRLGAAAADTFSRAIVHAILRATSGAGRKNYLESFPDMAAPIADAP